MGQILQDFKRCHQDHPKLLALADLIARMYADLDKSVRRSDEHTAFARGFGQFGAAATAAASAVGGTTLASGATGRPAFLVGLFTALLGVVGSIVASLKLGESVQANRNDHAAYLALLRKISAYVDAELVGAQPGNLDPGLMAANIGGFADAIRDIEESRAHRA